MLPWCFQFSWRALQSFPFCCSIVKRCSLKKAFFSLLAIFRNSAFSWVYLSLSPLLFVSLLSLAICKASSDSHFAFLLFFFFGIVLVAAFCRILQTSAHCFLGLISWIYSSPPLYIHKGFKLYLAGLVVLPALFRLSLNFATRSWWSETVSSKSCFCWLYLWLQRM